MSTFETGPEGRLMTMRRVATGALAVCAVGMVICRICENTVPALGWLRAFFEAATVGAVADWFAVVALFRHPLGIPIPHTAVLPRNKARVAGSLASFIESNFLTAERLGPRIRNVDFASIAAGWLESHAGLLAGKACDWAPRFLAGWNRETVAALLAGRARDFLLATDLAPAAGNALGIVVDAGRDREIFVSLVRSARDLIGEHRPMIQKKIREEVPISSELLAGYPFLKDLAGPWLEQLREGIASAVAAKTVEKVQQTFDEALLHSDHELWQSFQTRLTELIERLKASPELAQRIRSAQEALASSGAVEDFADAAWQHLEAWVIRECSEANSPMRSQFEQALRGAAREIRKHTALHDGINAFMADHVLAAALAAKPHARDLVVDTIAQWDAEEMASRLEEVAGRDLQFIRLNGTIVGGLVGLTIHAGFQLAGL